MSHQLLKPLAQFKERFADMENKNTLYLCLNWLLSDLLALYFSQQLRRMYIDLIPQWPVKYRQLDHSQSIVDSRLKWYADIQKRFNKPVLETEVSTEVPLQAGVYRHCKVYYNKALHTQTHSRYQLWLTWLGQKTRDNSAMSSTFSNWFISFIQNPVTGKSFVNETLVLMVDKHDNWF